MLDLDDTLSLAILQDLTIDEFWQQLPDGFSLPFDWNPLAEISSECIEVVLQPIRTKDRNVTRLQSGLQLVHHGISHRLCPPAKLDYRHQFGRRVADRPDPHILLTVSDTRPKFIQLNVFWFETRYKSIMEFLSMFAAASEPVANGALADLDEILNGGDVDPEDGDVERLPNFLRGCLQTIHHGVFATGEAIGAGVALQILNEFCFPTFSIPYNSMNVLIGDAEIVTSYPNFIGASCEMVNKG